MYATLAKRLYRDIRVLGLPTDFTLEIRGYSKTKFAMYEPHNRKVILYPLQSTEGKKYSYTTLLMQTVHEALHHYQWWHDPNFIRVKGVMHNLQFKVSEKEYRVKVYQLLNERKELKACV
jgi:hypothetical protein